MRITELFRSPTSLQKFDKAAIRQLGMYDIVSAYGANIGGKDYVFYFDNCSKQEGDYGFGFGVRRTDDTGVDHRLIKSAASPVKVFTAALQAIENFINEAHPLNVSFTGADTRQMQFYNVLSKKLAGDIPTGYKLLQQASRNEGEGRLYLTRDPFKLEDRAGYKIIENRIDELFDKPVADYELEDVTGADIRDVRLKFRVGNFDTGYLFNILGIEYLVFFTPVDGKRGWFDCSFGQYKPDGGIIYNLTGSSPRDQFKVFRMVFAGIQRFIATRCPVTIVGGGYIKRQSKFYAKLLQAYENRLPKPYFWAMDAGVPLISRSKAVVPERDHLDRLKAEAPIEEDASDDVIRVRVAERIVSRYIQWLAVNNEEKPLEDIMERTFRADKRENILFVSGETIGLAKGHHDLNIGFAWPAEGFPSGNARGWLNAMNHPMGGPRKYLACLVRESDPSKDTDLAYEMGYEAKQILVHEVTHYLDYKRSTIEPGSTQKLIKKRGQAAGYYNSPLEFNAFFQQGLHAVLKDFKERPMGSRFRKEDSLATFEQFLADHLHEFDRGYRDNLDDVYRRKFKRRLYKLYDLIRQNPNDIDKVAREAKGITD